MIFPIHCKFGCMIDESQPSSLRNFDLHPTQYYFGPAILNVEEERTVKLQVIFTISNLSCFVVALWLISQIWNCAIRVGFMWILLSVLWSEETFSHQTFRRCERILTGKWVSCQVKSFQGVAPSHNHLELCYVTIPIQSDAVSTYLWELKSVTVIFWKDQD